MKYEIGPFIKTFGPATATAEVQVIELSEGEKFDDVTIQFIGKKILEENQMLFDLMDFNGHQTFRLVLNFIYAGEIKSLKIYPVYTKNCNSWDSSLSA